MQPAKCDYPLTGLGWLEYYSKHDVYHPGKDYNSGHGNQDCGQPVKAAKGGFVEYVWNSTWNSGGFGKFIIIHHDDGNFTRYAHLQTIEGKIRTDERVKEGEVIGCVGNTGTVYCHLHFEVFNKECAKIQTNHWRVWRYYPSGKSKEWVTRHYVNPDEWLKDKVDTPDWAKIAAIWAKDEGIITHLEGGQITDYELALVLYRFHKKYIINP